MSVEVSVREHAWATEIVLGGVIGGDAMGILGNSIDDVVARTGTKIIFNLDDVTLLDRRGLESLMVPLTSRRTSGAVAVVCRRASAVRLLERWGMTKQLPVYRRLEDARHDGKEVKLDATPSERG